MGSHWEETKKSIRDARYRLSLSTNSEILDTKNNARINEVYKYYNGGVIKWNICKKFKHGSFPHEKQFDTTTSLETNLSGPEKDDLYLDLINP